MSQLVEVWLDVWLDPRAVVGVQLLEIIINDGTTKSLTSYQVRVATIGTEVMINEFGAIPAELEKAKKLVRQIVELVNRRIP